MKITGPYRQKEIYVTGVSGTLPNVPMHPARLEAAAQVNMSKEAFAYIAGGAGLGHTIQNNRDGFGQYKILPRMLKDVSERDISIELFGQRLPTPFLLSPVGVLEMAHKEADRAVGKATAELGVPYILSNQASVAMEDVASVMGDAPRWFQLYWSKSNDLVASLVKRAEASGCSAIVVTLDTTMLGWRIEDLDLAYLPFLRGKGIAQYVTDPVFLKLMNEPLEEDPNQPKRKLTPETISSIYQLMKSFPGGFFKNLKTKDPVKAVRKFINIYSRPSLTWNDLAFLRKQTKLPIVLKGILHPADAQEAIARGIDGIIVSNHGGRQVDGAVSTIEMLPSIVDVVKGKIPVIIDSGIRGGADVFKALAIGATAVCFGRPYVYGLAIDGAAGVSAVIKNMIADFELTMGLAGCKSIAEVNRHCIVMQ